MARIAVFVDSRDGNTRKVADAIAGELHVEVGDIAVSLPEDAGILFLGSGTYGGAPGIGMMKFVTDNPFSGRKAALFSTAASSAGSKKMIGAMADAMERKGAEIIGCWHCAGKFLILNRGRPNEEDLENEKKICK